MNSVILIGRLVADPTTRVLESSGLSMCDFTLAVDKGLSREKKAQMEASGKPTADFIRITVWGRLAELCSTYLKKGARCAVSGSINTSSYTNREGEKRYSVDVVARNVEFLERLEAKASSSFAPKDDRFYEEMADSIDSSFTSIDDSDEMPF